MSVPPFFRASLRLASDLPGQPPRKWSNTFYCEAPNAAAACALIVAGWVNYLAATCRERVYAYQVYATDLLPGTDSFFVQNIPSGQQRGTLPALSSDPYLPKACVSITIPVGASRPSRKFWRPGLYEGDVINGVSINTTLADFIYEGWNDFIVNAEGALLDPDRQPWEANPQLRLTTREFGREATADVPIPPPLG